MTKNKLVDAVARIVDVLSPLESEERLRVLNSAMAVLGESHSPYSFSAPAGATSQDGAGEIGALTPRTRAWMKQNGLSESELQNVFHVSNGEAELIAQVPGNNRKEQMYNAYILTGVGQMIAAGDGSFKDKQARDLCERSGCYDNTNHAAYLKNKGNEFTGSKEKGWTLTAPGLKRGADLIKELTKRDA